MTGIRSLAILTLLLAGVHAMLAADDAPRFSHKTHAPLKMPCTKCHTGAQKAAGAGFPGEEECKVCHTAFTAAQTKFPTKRVYRLPDFVFFSHKVHLDAKAECARCHGNVNATAAVTLAVPPTMTMCVDCHRETKASIECFVCHEIGQ